MKKCSNPKEYIIAFTYICANVYTHLLDAQILKYSNIYPKLTDIMF